MDSRSTPVATFVLSNDTIDKLIAGYIAERHGFTAERHAITLERKPEFHSLVYVHVRTRDVPLEKKPLTREQAEDLTRRAT